MVATELLKLAMETDEERKARLKKMVATTQLRLAPETEDEKSGTICRRLEVEELEVEKFVDYTHCCESSISLEGGRSKDRLRLCRLFTSFQECPH